MANCNSQDKSILHLGNERTAGSGRISRCRKHPVPVFVSHIRVPVPCKHRHYQLMLLVLWQWGKGIPSNKRFRNRVVHCLQKVNGNEKRPFGKCNGHIGSRSPTSLGKLRHFVRARRNPAEVQVGYLLRKVNCDEHMNPKLVGIPLSDADF